MPRPQWTARCKSGYQWLGRDGKLRTCNAVTPRAALMCSACLEAQPAEVIIRGGDLIRYFRLKRNGYVTTWSGEGKLCMVIRSLAWPIVAAISAAVTQAK